MKRNKYSGVCVDFLATQTCNPRTQEAYRLEGSLEINPLQKNQPPPPHWSKKQKQKSNRKNSFLIRKRIFGKVKMTLIILPKWHFFLGSAQGQSSGMKQDYCVHLWSSLRSDLFMPSSPLQDYILLFTSHFYHCLIYMFYFINIM